MSFLLAIIYAAFISLGLPDAMLGSAWPEMSSQMGAPLSYAGIVSMIISAGTIVASLFSDKLTRKLGAGRVTAFSVALTAAALFGFSFSKSFFMLCLIALPYGLGAGAVDVALNNYVALHYEARHMSWLHCFWGIGASLGPYIMGACLTGGLTWNRGYQAVGLIQVVLTAVLFLSLPKWKRETTAEKSGEKKERKSLGMTGLIKLPGAKAALIAFFCYCALEQTIGFWAASYMVLNRGISAETAAKWASLFYLGITGGRFASGFITMKLNDKNMIRLGEGLIGFGILLILLPFGNGSLCLGLIVSGLGCAPIYPSLLHATPEHFGADLSQSIMGLQMAFAYIGTLIMPPVFGILAQHISIRLYPFCLMVLAGVMIFGTEMLNRKKVRKC